MLKDSKKDHWIWRALVILGLSGILFMALVSMSGGTFFDQQHDVLNYFVTFGIALLVSGACFCTGALMGFLFGIPRIINSTSIAPTRSTVLQNDNLVQISDWLTKIIVGVGLTQIYQIPDFLGRIGAFLSPCFNQGTTGSAIAICLVLYFLILGFIACYLWTRFYFSEMLEETINDDNQGDDNVNKMVNTTVHNMTINSPDPVAVTDTSTTSSANADVPNSDTSNLGTTDAGTSTPAADISSDPFPTDADPSSSGDLTPSSDAPATTDASQTTSDTTTSSGTADTGNSDASAAPSIDETSGVISTGTDAPASNNPSPDDNATEDPDATSPDDESKS